MNEPSGRKPFERFPISRRCPHCGNLHRFSTYIGSDTAPDGEDADDQTVSVCRDCGEIYIIVSETKARKPTKREEEELKRSELVRSLRFFWMLEQAMKPPTKH